MLKVQQKVFSCFRSDSGAAAFARLRGYLSTLRKQGHALLTALEAHFSGQPRYPAFARTGTTKREPRRSLIKLKSFSMKRQRREIALNTSHNLALRHARGNTAR
jgi:hypothetical protein